MMLYVCVALVCCVMWRCTAVCCILFVVLCDGFDVVVMLFAMWYLMVRCVVLRVVVFRIVVLMYVICCYIVLCFVVVCYVLL